MPSVRPIVAVLDDEAEMRKALRRLLTCHGFEVREYGRGEDFLADLGSGAPACLLLDLHMPGASGFDVLEALRGLRMVFPAVVITAHDEPGTALRVHALGAAGYLKKPVDREVLLSAMQAAMESRARPCEHPPPRPNLTHRPLTDVP